MQTLTATTALTCLIASSALAADPPAESEKSISCKFTTSHSQLTSGASISRPGLSAADDLPRYFVRVAWGPHVNFTAQDMLRLSAGVQF